MSFKEIINKLHRPRKNEAADENTSALRKTILSCLGIIPAVFIEVIAYLTLHGKDIGTDTKYAVITHIAAALCLLLPLTKLIKIKVPALIRWIPVIVSPPAAFFMLEFLTHNPFDNGKGGADMTRDVILFNISFFVIALFTLIFITGRTAPAVITVTAVPLILGLISYFTVEFRGTPLFPWDIASYGIASTVLGGYDLTLTPLILMIISLAILTCVVAVVWNVRVKFPWKAVRPVLAGIMCLVSVCALSYVQTDRAISDFRLYPYLFTPGHLYKTNGFTVSFLMNLRYATVDKPDGYSSDTAEDIASTYESDSDEKSDKLPNIIVIMNESFADMTALADFKTSVEIMPFIKSLTENTVKGTLHTSVVGGNTPNSEFEFLTGMTMGYLPSGSIPYQQFVKSESPSLVSQLDELGYHTVAMHPYPASGWKRDKVYSYFGFEEMHFSDVPGGSFTGKRYLRNYVSDSGLYSKIFDVYEEKEEDTPLFVFAVTMQNHSGYTGQYGNFTPDVNTLTIPTNEALTNYLSLIKRSDEAFRELVEYFAAQEEDTVILMFGDHQPNDSVANPILYFTDSFYDEQDIEASENRYKVPYVIWSNYEMPLEEVGDTSINYLSSLLAEAAGIPKTGEQKFLLSVREKFPVITGRCIIDSTGKYHPISDYESFSELREYAIVQYNYLFDKDSLTEEFYTLK
ncbi:MAG: LTA synthase family protein [Clostridia bacterium]|nr:LTA synthase family protein [Clostridia bacterium]